MSVTVDINEAEQQFNELLSKVGAGEDIIIARGSAPVIRMTRVVRDPEIERAITEIREARKNIAPTTIEEILAWRDDGERRGRRRIGCGGLAVTGRENRRDRGAA